MKSFNRIILFLLVLLSFSGSGISFGRTPVTHLANNNTDLSETPIVMVEPMSTGESSGKGNTVLGLIAKVIGLRESLDPKRASEGFAYHVSTGSGNYMKIADPKSFAAKVVLPYLLESQEIKDALKLRKLARSIRFQEATKDLANDSSLSKELKEKILQYYSQSIGAPLVVSYKPMKRNFLGSNGAYMSPSAVAYKLNDKWAVDSNYIAIMDSGSLFKKKYTLKSALAANTLCLTVAHENAHAIMHDMYGKSFEKIKRISNIGHHVELITDFGLAYVEGWAEAFEAIYGAKNPKLASNEKGNHKIADFRYDRQSPIRRNRYVWTLNSGKPTGELKNGSQLMATEGVIAGFFYDILTSRAIVAPFEKCVKTMLKLPLDFMDFVKEYVKLFPDDKKVIYRIILENSHYVTMDKSARHRYKEFYSARNQFVQKKMAKADFYKIKDNYKTYTDSLFKKAMDGVNIFSNVGKELWIEGKLQPEMFFSKSGFVLGNITTLAKISGTIPFRIDLNTANDQVLKLVGFAEEDRKKILEARDKTEYFSNDPVEALRSAIGNKFVSYNVLMKIKPLEIQFRNQEPEAIAWPETLQGDSLDQN